MAITSFRDLKVWEKSHELVLSIYQLTKKLPEEEKYGLISQVRRAAISIPANIVEGYRRNHIKDSLHFYNIANASLEELRYESQIAHDLGYIAKDEYAGIACQTEESSKMLNSRIKSQKKF